MNMTLKNNHLYLSIIVLYNLGRLLSSYINSLLSLNISSSNYETILVDDTSTDPEIIRIINRYKDHGNVKVIIEKENRWLLTARDIRLKSAQSNYIWFVNADDEVKENCLAQLSGFALNQGTEIPILQNYISAEKEKISNKKQIESCLRMSSHLGLTLETLYVQPYQNTEYGQRMKLNSLMDIWWKISKIPIFTRRSMQVDPFLK